MSITLPESVISLVSFFPVCMRYLLVSRFGLIWTREGLPAEETMTLKSAKDSQKVKSCDQGINECAPLIGVVHAYLQIINYVWSRHGLGLCLDRRWAWAQPRPLSSIIVGPRGFASNALSLSSSRLISLS